MKRITANQIKKLSNDELLKIRFGKVYYAEDSKGKKRIVSGCNSRICKSFDFKNKYNELKSDKNKNKNKEICLKKLHESLGLNHDIQTGKINPIYPSNITSKRVNRGKDWYSK